MKTPKLATILAASALLAACGGGDPTGPDVGTCAAEVSLFPVPVSDATSLFGEVDDDFLFVSFTSGFQFSFYGTQYPGVFLNTNGGMTFDTGSADYEEAADYYTMPGIGVFWGDLDAEDAPTRANQMTYQACSAGFIVRYNQLQDYDEDTQNNTATVTLEANGKITIVYGIVLSTDIVAGVWNGDHTDNRRPALANSYSGYATSGSGTILFDYYGPGPQHAGQLTNRTIVYNP
jgi:hypothetical protein